jgi:Prenyltransferase and squalene oxidase repeat
MSANNSRPKTAPVIVLREEPGSMGRYLLLMLPAMIGSILFHAGLVGIFIAYVLCTMEAGAAPPGNPKDDTIAADPVEQDKTTFTVIDVDPSMQESDTDIQYMADRIAEVSVPGSVNANEAVGIRDGDKSAAPVNLPAPGGYITKGQGGARDIIGEGNSTAVGEIGGYGPKGMPLQGTFYGRSGATREYALREGGGTSASEAAVAKGLQWLIRQQQQNGSWTLNAGNRASAGTAFGLLPFLAAGKTHKAAKDNPYDKQIAKALDFLKKQQDKDGFFRGGDMYDHGLATITICEAYALSQDPTLRSRAQKAIDVIVKAQSETGGGWGYKRNGGADMSVSGWQMMALKSGQMAGLDIPSVAFERAKRFLDAPKNAGKSDGGFGYQVPESASTARMSAVGLLCRQYMQNKGPSDGDMQKGVKNFLTKNPPGIQDVYYYYYATQVMHHFGGEAWHDWNEKMREYLIKKQDVTKGPNFGSWSPEGDPWAGSGGRLMITSLNLLTLEVYYRYLPLYYRDAGYGKDAAVQKAL